MSSTIGESIQRELTHKHACLDRFTMTDDPDFGLLLESVNGVAGNKAKQTYWELLSESSGKETRLEAGEDALPVHVCILLDCHEIIHIPVSPPPRNWLLQAQSK